MAWRLVAGLALVLWAGSAVASVPDSGAFKIYQDGRAIGVESFSYILDADSMLVSARARLLLPSTPQDTFYKDAGLVVKAVDYDLRTYKSSERMGGDSQDLERVKTRGLVVGDTAMTVYQQTGLMGEGTRVVRPPGKIFIVDPLVYTMFDVIGRNLHGSSFDRRRLQLMVLVADNAIVEAFATDLGRETIPWGGRPVNTRKIEVSDGQLKFVLWLSPIGRMLKLEEATTGLRVEREPPPVKRRKRSSG